MLCKVLSEILFLFLQKIWTIFRTYDIQGLLYLFKKLLFAKKYVDFGFVDLIKGLYANVFTLTTCVSEYVVSLALRANFIFCPHGLQRQFVSQNGHSLDTHKMAFSWSGLETEAVLYVQASYFSLYWLFQYAIVWNLDI